MRIVRIANFVTPTSGGIRTVLGELSAASQSQGVHSHVIAPGPDAGLRVGRGIDGLHHVPGVRFNPRQEYRLALARAPIRRLLEALRPDVVEVHDQLTFGWVGAWCRAEGVRSVLVAHERLDQLGRLRATVALARPLRSGVSAASRAVQSAAARAFDVVVTPSRYAAEPYERYGEVIVVPWAVDHRVFHPSSGPSNGAGVESGPQADGRLRLVHAGRLSPEKEPEVSLRTAEDLHRGGVDVHLTVVGSGPLEPALRRRAERHLPGRVTFTGHRTDRRALADELRTADVFLAPGPCETFGIGALEAMACGTPVVCRSTGAVGELPHARAAEPADFADACCELYAGAHRERVSRAALDFTWQASSRGLAVAYGSPARPTYEPPLGAWTGSPVGSPVGASPG